MTPDLKTYIRKFSKLRVDRSHGVAPHKPILLLAVMHGIRIGEITDGKVFLTPELIAHFRAYWKQGVTTNHDCRISYPFFYMKSEGFWKLHPREGFSEVEQMGSLVKSLANLHAAVAYAELDAGLFRLLTEAESHAILREVLIQTYFPESQGRLTPMNEDSELDQMRDDFLHEPPARFQRKVQELILQKDDDALFLRGSVFRREVPRVYGYRCCISGMMVTSLEPVSMIDACHIVPFSEGHDDTVGNGLALCPNLHRAFDRGLVTITPEYRIKVSEQFMELGDYSIRMYEGKSIQLPDHPSYWPLPENLLWHQQNVFRHG